MLRNPLSHKHPDFQVRGAYTRVEALVGLHRFAKDLNLEVRNASAQQSGEWKTHFRGRGIDFEEVRLYQPGDDIRAIDWRVTARTGTTHTKVYREDRERPVILAADQRSPMFFGSRHCFKSVMAAHLLCCLGWAALANRDRIGGLVFGDDLHRDIRPRRSKHAMLEWIRQLDTFNQRLSTPCSAAGSQSLAQVLERLVHICRPGNAVFVASDFHDLDDDCLKRFHQLARHTDLTLFCISDPLERGLSEPGSFWVSNGEHRSRFEGVAGAGVLARCYDERLALLRHHCGPLGISLVELDTGADLRSLLLQRYGRRGAR